MTVFVLPKCSPFIIYVATKDVGMKRFSSDRLSADDIPSLEEVSYA